MSVFAMILQYLSLSIDRMKIAGAQRQMDTAKEGRRLEQIYEEGSLSTKKQIL